MKNIKNILTIAILFATFLSSCTEGLGDDPIAGSDLTNSDYIVGWANSIVTESYFEDLGILNNTYAINILGGQDGSPSDSDISVTLSIDDSTTALGGEFSLPSTEFTIPAGSLYALVPIDIDTGSFNPTQPTEAVINVVTSANGVVISDSAKQMIINFVGCQSTIADFMYEVTITSSTGGVYGPYLEPVLMESVNSFMTYSAGTWDPPLNPGHGIRFGDICGTLTMPKVQGLVDIYSNEVTPRGTAQVDENGNFTLKYTIGFGAGPRDYTAVYIKQ